MDFKDKVHKFKSYEEVVALPGFVEGEVFEKEYYANILGVYRFKERVRCCFFRENRVCNTAHNHGYAVELKNGSVTIIGNECVYKLGNEEKLLKDVKLLKKEEERQDKMQVVKDKIGDSICTYEEVFEAYEKAKRLENIIVDLFGRLPRSVGRSLEQRVKTDTKNIAVTLVYDRKYIEDGEEKTESDYVRTAVYSIKGLRFLNLRLITSAKRKVSDAVKTIKSFEAITNNTSYRQLSDISKGFSLYQRQLGKINEFEKYYYEFLTNDFRYFSFLSDFSSENSKVIKCFNDFSTGLKKNDPKAAYKEVRAEVLVNHGAARIS
ncbi:hypothetical protein HZU72_22315 [Halomonas sp. QX-2]|uniref:Uncharacterized protein n=1 Tax=Vreelandella sedimenti TaxID=2729618 RepID=A0A7Z0SPQ6_9GAMM|nr:MULTISPECIES: hypothetical protein [Halomonas]NYT75125.1 hypothetical protein [Halomonas sedimenti]|tara:strand:- start:3261 stop:4223 length:963 start_codon:yes stop_codon:yes gene_type:complete